jgi:hypothetical protein
MKFLILLLFVIGCSNLPPKPNYKVGDCYSLLTRDLQPSIGVDTGFEMQIYKISRQKGSDGIYRNYLMFRPILRGKYWKDVNLKPKKWSEATGVIWMEEWEFRRTLYTNDGSGGLDNFGFSQFSYGEGTRNGITCNDIHAKDKDE